MVIPKTLFSKGMVLLDTEGVFLMGKIESKEVVRTDKKVKSFTLSRRYSYDADEGNDLAGISEEDWLDDFKETVTSVIDTGDVERLAYCIHDKDKPQKDESNPLHGHILVKFKTGKTHDEVDELFKLSGYQDNNQQIKTWLGSSRYLTHRSDAAYNDMKYEYPREDVFTYNCDYDLMLSKGYWSAEDLEIEGYKIMNKDSAEKLVNEYSLKVFEGAIRASDALDVVSEKAGYHYREQCRRRFEDAQLDYMAKKVIDLQANGRNNKNIYIMGEGSIGKTKMGQRIGLEIAGTQSNYFMAAPQGKGKTPDSLNHYAGQRVAQFDELNPSGWGLDEFNAVFDPHNYAPFPSRNENKHFVGDTSIFTNSISPLKFAKDLVIYSKGGKDLQKAGIANEINLNNPIALDKYWQVRRRLSTIIILLKDDTDDTRINVHVFNLKTGLKKDISEDNDVANNDRTHVLVGTAEYINKAGSAPVISDDELTKIMDAINVNVHELDAGELESIDSFLERNGIVDKGPENIVDEFVNEVVPELVWDLLPTNFIYDLFKAYMRRNAPAERVYSKRDFTEAFTQSATDWAWKENAVRTGTKMDLDEPLITDYHLEEWVDKHYRGPDFSKMRNFNRKSRYRGFVRK